MLRGKLNLRRNVVNKKVFTTDTKLLYNKNIESMACYVSLDLSGVTRKPELRAFWGYIGAHIAPRDFLIMEMEGIHMTLFN